jgi:transcriptional regulator with XRE-family HTH domain
MTASTIGERIKAVRLHAGLGQEAFATALGYSKRALVSWELGGAEPPVAALVKLRQAYDVDVEWLALGEDTVPRSYYGPVDWDRLDRLTQEIAAVSIDVGLKLPPERCHALARVLYDSGADTGAANRKQVRGTLLALSLGT